MIMGFFIHVNFRISRLAFCDERVRQAYTVKCVGQSTKNLFFDH